MNTIEEILVDVKAGKPVIIVDDENRENEGDLIISAEKINFDILNFIISKCKGLLCVSLDEKILEEKGLKQMVEKNSDNFTTAFAISVDSNNTTTGISVKDRLTTIKGFTTKWKLEDFKRPGHLFPLAAKTNGVFKRLGHTETSVDLMKLANLKPVGVICEILNDDGTMARLPQLEIFAKKYGFKISSVEKLVEYRKKNEVNVKQEVCANLPTSYGDFKMVGFSNILDNKEHFALVKGDVKNKKSVLVRVHSECLTGDLLGSSRCDCGTQLRKSLEKIEEEKLGLVIYLRQEGRGIGLFNKLEAYNLQDKGFDTIEANHELGFKTDERDYVIAAWILKSLKVKTIRLITNNPEKIEALKRYGIEIEEIIKLDIKPTPDNKKYLETKKKKLGHTI